MRLVLQLTTFVREKKLNLFDLIKKYNYITNLNNCFPINIYGISAAKLNTDTPKKSSIVESSPDGKASKLIPFYDTMRIRKKLMKQKRVKTKKEIELK